MKSDFKYICLGKSYSIKNKTILMVLAKICYKQYKIFSERLINIYINLFTTNNT